ncbi:MAG: LON peptidase substrate-binding domain-containing protein, partial [Victivallaceae bacterium]|nr:LON peptidase substrate-binding domain-containing protein [Victivallaceae bacterium]
MANKTNNGSITVKSDSFKSKDEKLPDNCVPILTLQGMLVFPYTLTPMVIDGEEKVKMIKKSTGDNRLIAIFPEVPTQDDTPNDSIELKTETVVHKGKTITRMGVIARIVKMLNFPDGTVRVLVRGLKRIVYDKPFVDNENVDCIIYKNFKSKPDNSLESSAMLKNAINQFQKIISFSPNFPEELKIAILNLDDNVRLVDLIADTLNIDFVEKLSLLTQETLHERLQTLMILLNREVEVLHLGSEIQSQVHNALSRSQRDFFLREQLKTIQHELGEDNKTPDIIAIEKKLETLELPENVSTTVSKELERLMVIPQASPEYHVAFNYVDWLVSVPWMIYSEDRLDVNDASRILEHDHYGLEDIKERILEF